MPLLRRHKYILLALAIYWPTLFIITHIPIMEIAKKSGMSDKTMHVLAYLCLVALIWLAISPYNRVNWRKTKVWAVIAVIVWYGAIDEWLQGFMGRSADVKDFYADMFGSIIGLGILSTFNFWTALLIISGMFIFIITNMSRIDQLAYFQLINTSFHFISYAIFTVIWIQYSFHHLNLARYNSRPVKWILFALSAPACLLTVVKICTLLFGKRVWPMDLVTALTGIIIATAVSYFTCWFTTNLWIEDTSED